MSDVNKVSKMSNVAKVYKLYNLVDSRIFIGSTFQDLCRRMTDHKKLAATSSLKLYKAMQELGVDNFKYALVEQFDFPKNPKGKALLKERENHYINVLDSINKGLNDKVLLGKKCQHGRLLNAICDECNIIKGVSQILAEPKKKVIKINLLTEPKKKIKKIKIIG